MHLTSRLRGIAVVSLVALVAIVLAACGSSSSSSSSSSTSSSSSSSGSGSVAKAQALVTKAEAPIQFTAPKPFDMAKNKGKTIWWIGFSLQVPFVVSIGDGATEAAKAAGMTLKTFDGKGQADQFNQGMSEAISQHADGIVLQAIPTEVVSGEIAAAEAAGIPVVDTFNRGPNTKLPKGVGGQVTLDYAQSGRTMADFIAADSGGKATVGGLTWGIDTIYKEMVPAFEEELGSVCSGCSVASFKSVSPTSPATEVQNLTTTMLQQNPKIDYLAPVSDNIAGAMVPAVEAKGESNIKLVSADGDEANLNNVEKSKVQIADVSDPPLNSVGWAQVDQLGRLMAGQPTSPEDADLPTQLFTTKNIVPAAKRFPGYEGFQAKYETQVWGLK
jgi:ribose transport system substrate-binding protein